MLCSSRPCCRLLLAERGKQALQGGRVANSIQHVLSSGGAHRAGQPVLGKPLICRGWGAREDAVALSHEKGAVQEREHGGGGLVEGEQHDAPAARYLRQAEQAQRAATAQEQAGKQAGR